MFRKKKGGYSLEYTPLIKAIQERDEWKVRRLLDAAAMISPEKAHEVANEKDNTYGWSPMKWANFMYLHGPNHDTRNNQISCNIIAELLVEHGVDIRNDFDNRNEFTYSYEPYPPIDEILRSYSEENNNNRNVIRGGDSPTEQQRIRTALDGNYTPLINAIIRGSIEEVRRLLETGANPNQRDGDARLNWCPFKWIAFVNNYGNIYNDEEYEEAVTLLHDHGARTCFDDNHVRENSYNYSPVITDIDEQLEQLRREAEEDYYSDDDLGENRRNMAGGRRRRKLTKSRKHKKTHKKLKKTSAKRRKHIKK